MIKTDKAAFRFTKFRVPKFSYDSPKNQDDGLNIMFDPSGIYYENEGKFELKVVFKGVQEEDSNNTVIEVTGVAEFKFQENIKLSEIPEYFYSNSIAIVFPYLRSFVSTLTMQSNNGVIMLGLMNFTSLSSVLKEKTEAIKA